MAEIVGELVEKKTEEIEKKAAETTDKVLDDVQANTQKVADKVEDVVEKAAKPLTDLVDKLDDNPHVKKVLDGVTESIVQQVDGREFSCFCFGLGLSLRISRKSRQSSPSKVEGLDNRLPKLPSLNAKAKEVHPSKVVVRRPSAAPVGKTSVA